MYENVTVCITPKGEKPVLHFSQFDNENVFTVTVLADDGKSAAVLTGLDIEFRLRKTDSHVVTIAPESVADNVITFKTTEQMCACCGQNIASVVLMKDDMNIATLDILVEIQRDILSGGLTSESDIRNLTTQIEQIVPEVIGDDYYTKTEVDDLIADIPTFDPTNYYDKSDVSDLPDMTNYYTKSEVDTKITDLYQIKTASGSIVHITDGGNAIPVKSLVSEIVAVETGNGQPKSPDNPYTISGFDNGIITVTDNDQITNTYTFTFGQTVYGGYFDNKGNLVVTHGYKDLGALTWLQDSAYGSYFYTNGFSDKASGLTNMICSEYENATGYGNRQPDLTIRGAESGNYHRLFIRNNAIADATAFNTAIQGVMLCYELETPITLAITSQDIPTLLGENNIFSNCGDVEVKYFTSKSDGIAELIKAFM